MQYYLTTSNKSVEVVGEQNDTGTTGTATYSRHIVIHIIVPKKALPAKPRPIERQSNAKNSDIRRFTKNPDEHIYPMVEYHCAQYARTLYNCNCSAFSVIFKLCHQSNLSAEIRYEYSAQRPV